MPPQPPRSPAPADESDDELLLRLSGQTEVRETDHARQLLAVATRAEAEARDALERTRWPMRMAKLRMLPVVLRMPPLVAALVLASVLLFAVAIFLIVTRLADAVTLVGVILLGYTLGFGVILQLLKDAPDEHDENRATVRRRKLQDAIDARVAAAAKVARLAEETVRSRDRVDRLITYEVELARRARLRSRMDMKPSSSPPPPPPSPPPTKTDVEYGGG
jgi:hypothetical protein